MKRPGLVIFDCDGVLVDTEPLSNASLVEGLAELGIETTVEDTRKRYLGLSWPSVLADIEDRLGTPVPEGWLDRRRARDFELYSRFLKAIPGVDYVIARVRRAGLPYCVASSGSIDKMRFTLEHTGLLPNFEGVLFSSSMVPRGKPHPDLFLHAAARMGIAASETAVIEDSVNGVTAARAAGMRVLAFARDPLSDRAGLEGAGGELFTDMEQVPSLLSIP